MDSRTRQKQMTLNNFNKITVRLSQSTNYKETFDLKFNLLTNNFVPKWINRYLMAQQRQDKISEPWALYQLNNKFTSDFCIQKLNSLIDKVNSYENLFPLKLDSINNQDALNKIHSIFELHHGKLDDWLLNPLFKNKPKEFRQWLSEINQFVHLCEDQNRPKVPQIRCVWFDLPKTEIFNADDYKLFTNKIEFGTIYSLYADVGKNLESLSTDNDKHHHNFVPNRHYSVDCRITFFDRSDDEVNKRLLKYKEHYKNNKEYFMSEGYDENDIRLTTGQIPLAKIETTLSKTELLKKIALYDNIQGFFIT